MRLQGKNKEELIMKNKTYQLETLTCPGCVLKIEGAVKSIKGVNEVQVLFNASKVKVNFDESLVDDNEIRKTIERVGFDVLGEK
jgi:copper chaperone